MATSVKFVKVNHERLKFALKVRGFSMIKASRAMHYCDNWLGATLWKTGDRLPEPTFNWLCEHYKIDKDYLIRSE